MLHWYNSAQSPKVRNHIKKKGGKEIFLSNWNWQMVWQLWESHQALMATAPKESAQEFPSLADTPVALGSLQCNTYSHFSQLKANKESLTALESVTSPAAFIIPQALLTVGLSHLVLKILIYFFIQMRYLNISCLFRFSNGDAHGHFVIRGKWWHVCKAAMKPLEY